MIDEPQWYYFTFGFGQKNAGYYVKIYGTYGEAREKMFERYGSEWAFQYTEEQWKTWERRCIREGMTWMLEKELK